MAKTKKKLKKLKKRVKSLEENQCYIEQKLDKLTEWLEDNLEQSEPESNEWVEEDSVSIHNPSGDRRFQALNKEELDAEDEVAILNAETNEVFEAFSPKVMEKTFRSDYLTNDEAEAEEYSYKIEALEAKLRAGGITHRISYESYLQQLVNEMRDEKAIGKFGDRTNPPTNSYRPL